MVMDIISSQKKSSKNLVRQHIPNIGSISSSFGFIDDDNNPHPPHLKMMITPISGKN